ncbi:4-hydroxybenzoate polyprenyltransferase [Campylobacter insulaenigrae]|uniref:menaquinone biosynthesis prenyltransferase MqnP n=1 Tax=Campylobacter insulaenigrae TaxID=260714 RepID=UPI000F6D63E0|nr:menaquinone biosynthesis prenyltransferase MqnP [Campylobacter insulaenigrae]MCR6570999.1 4-hydroxybenzoate polyprenyltransferase [Campylobacter insulaenigrae]MCR6572581.1 4-hydroxybenzoate polyprenyltransferase [Campylobacter insulaenigrae]MCR6573933.1 4-hydroxybenzoate polyprenyltransferase [Campylobacter insulaenigrae]MCR6575673.1 4-hydroxybenzoate polyprenyltransferase [Campylobacter insulaenigrae]MCR6576955.1 4-hydroxybenzoate polyprenyltransferase [Campylobacter insulaenigrae]
MDLYKNKIKDILDLIVFKHSIFALPFLFVSMFVASVMLNNSTWIGFKALFLGVICAVSARNFAMAVNRLMDEDIDRNNPRCANRPSVDGRIGKSSILLFIILNAIIFVLSSYFINKLAFALSLPVLFILAIYSAFKRFSSLAHLVLGFCLGLAPIAGSVIILGKIEIYSVILCLGVTFWTAGFDLLYALQDMDYDKKVGLHSIPAKFGSEATLFLSAFCHVLAVLFWFLFVWVAPTGNIAFAGVIVSALILFLEHKIVRKNFSKIDKAFFTLNGYLSIIFFIFIWVDLLWN